VSKWGGEQTFDEASADEGASTEALASRPAERVKLHDQGRHFGRIEEFRNVAYSLPKKLPKAMVERLSRSSHRERLSRGLV
jgi:hypothetical protein